MVPGTAVRYFDWLYDRVRSGSYLRVSRFMHDVSFRVIVDHDENRVADAGELRREFLDVHKEVPPGHPDLQKPDASIFEILVVLTLKAEFQSVLPAPIWYGMFLQNLGLQPYQDNVFAGNERRVAAILRRFNERLYHPSGRGGLFPLNHPECDQREIELWYQLAAYLTEKRLY